MIGVERRPLVIAAMIALGSAGAVAEARWTPVQPADYVSPGGACRLHVSPSRRNGEGAASYRMTCGSSVSWQATLPYTLLAAQVSDDGWAAGHSYTFGDPQWLVDDNPGIVESPLRHSLQLIAIDPRGRDRILHGHAVRIDHDPWHGFIGAGGPQVRGILLDALHDRVIFRLRDHGAPEYWTPFRLSDGRAFAEIRPRSDTHEVREDKPEDVDDARAVAGTPLSIVQFERGTTPWSTSRFALLDSTGVVVWTLDDPDKTTHFAPATVATSRPGTFDLRLRNGAQHVTFRVTPDNAKGGAWTVREIAGRPWTPPAMPPAPDPFAALPLLKARPLGTIVLGGEASRPFPHIHGVRAFEIDDRGRFGFLRPDGLAGRALVVVGPDGALVREVTLPDHARRADVTAAWAGGDLWIVVATGDGKSGRALLVDVAAGETRDVSLPKEGGRLMGGRRGHGFAIVSTEDGGTAFARHQMLVFDANGVLRKTVAVPATGGEGAVELPSGQWVVLDGGRLRVLDPEHPLPMDRAASWSEATAWAHDLAADMDSGILVKHADGDFVLRLKGDGSVRAKLKPRSADGRVLEAWWSPHVDPQGRLWVSDGDSLLRFADDGRVDAILGADAAGPLLGRISLARVDATGRIHALDARTAAVYSFDSSGVAAGVCRQTEGPGKFHHEPKLLVGPSGEVWAPDDIVRAPSFVVHCDSGRKVRWPGKLTPLHARPDGTFWAAGVMELLLVSEGAPRRIQRRADGRWLEQLAATAMAPDGSLAVESEVRVWSLDAPTLARTLNLYDHDGTPRRTIAVPASCPGRLFAYDGTYLFLWNDGEVRLFDVEGRAVQRVVLPGVEGGGELLPQIAPGDEIWLIEPSTRRVIRFERPPMPPGRAKPIAPAAARAILH
jgi:hypothetical protein